MTGAATKFAIIMEANNVSNTFCFLIANSIYSDGFYQKSERFRSTLNLSLWNSMNIRSPRRDGSFHQTFSHVLCMGNFLGFPIVGVFANNVSSLRFLWKSLRAIFFLVYFTCWLIKHGNPNLPKFMSLVTTVRNILCLLCKGSRRSGRNWLENGKKLRIRFRP